MCEAGLAKIHWVEAQHNERFDPAKLDDPQCMDSLRTMRERLLTQAKPTAMVGIGGMEGLLEEFEMFMQRQQSGSVYLFRSTGGMARILADELEEIRTDDLIPAGCAAQSTPCVHSSLLEFNKMNQKRVHIVEKLIDNRDLRHRKKRDLVKDFLEFRDTNFGRKELLMEAINPPYGYLSNLLVKKIVGIERADSLAAFRRVLL